MGSSEIFIALNDGLMLSNIFEWEGKIGSTGVAGACLQLLGGYSDLPSYLRDPPGNALEALKRLSVSEEDEPQQMFTIDTLEDMQKRDLSSEEILAETTLAG